MNKEVLLEEAKRLGNIITHEYTGKNGLPFAVIDGKTGEILSKSSFVDDLGDYVQYVWWLGKIAGDEFYSDYAENQIRIVDRLAFSKNGFFNSKITAEQLDNSAGFLTAFYPGATGDVIVGLATMYAVAKDEFALHAANKLVAGASRSLVNDCIPRAVLPAFSLYLPIATPDTTGNYIEELVNLAAFTGRQEYTEMAERLLAPWVNDQFFFKWRLFPSKKLIRFNNKLGRGAANFLLDRLRIKNLDFITSMIKHNTNLIYGVLNLYKETKNTQYKETVESWALSVEDKLLTKDGFYSQWDARSERGCYIALASNHALIDVFLEVHRAFGDKRYLKIAERAAHAWLSRQGKTGLFPESPMQKELRRAKLDPNVDMIVVLLKLYEITRNEEYLRSADMCIDGILKFHRAEHGFVWAVDSESGEFLCTTIHVKFLALLLKALLLAQCIAKGDKIYGSEEISMLIRDR